MLGAEPFLAAWWLRRPTQVNKILSGMGVLALTPTYLGPHERPHPGPMAIMRLEGPAGL